MTVQPDPELREWIDDWQQDAEPAAAARERIRARVKRQSFRQKLFVAGEWAVGAGILAFLAAAVWGVSNPLEVPVALAFLLLLAGTVAYSVWNRRGLWKPSAETASAFLALSEARCRGRLRAVRASYVILAIEIAIFAPWIWSRLGGAAGPALARAYAFLAVFVAVAVMVLVLIRRRTLRDLGELDALRSQIED